LGFVLRRHVLDILVRELTEGGNAGLFDPCALAMLDRIPASGELLAAVGCKLACARERHAFQSTETHFGGLVLALVEKDPALCAGRIDDEIEPAAIGVTSNFAECLHTPRAQPIDFPSHRSP
jgi:hypothetical protein